MRRSRTSVSGRPWLARRATRVGSTGLVGLIVVVSMLLGPAASGAWLQATPEASPVAGGADVPVVLFASDGMRPDLVTQYAGEGVTPTFADLLATGVQGDNGLLQAFPPNTGTGWHTLATGTWPSEHGSTNNTFHRTGSADFAGTTGQRLRPRHPSGRYDRPGGRAGREDGCRGGMGWGTGVRSGPARTGDRLPRVPLRSRRAGEL